MSAAFGVEAGRHGLLAPPVHGASPLVEELSKERGASGCVCFGVAAALASAFRRQLEAADERKVARIVAEAAEQESSSVAPGAAAGDDWERMRGFPLHTRRVNGTMRGTDPFSEVIRRDEQPQRVRQRREG